MQTTCACGCALIAVRRRRRVPLCAPGGWGQEFQPDNLIYTFEEKFSLSGLFQRLDNFLAKELDEVMEVQRETARLDTVRAALEKEFPQKDELALVRENHEAIIRELQRMQDDAGYVSTWEPKTKTTLILCLSIKFMRIEKFDRLRNFCHTPFDVSSALSNIFGIHLDTRNARLYLIRNSPRCA